MLADAELFAALTTSFARLPGEKMKAYILTEKDFEELLLRIDRDPKHGSKGGSSCASVRDSATERIYDEVHRFYNYQLRTWIDSVQK